MASLIEQLIQSHGSQIAEQITTQLGIPADKAAGILPAIAPHLLGGNEPSTEQVENEGGPGLLDTLGGFLSQPAGQAQGLSGIPGLGGLLSGGAGSQIVESLAEKVGIPKEKASEVIAMLGPIILGYLTKGKGQSGGGSMVTSMLDRDGDGQILDDVAGMLGVGGTLGSLLGADDGKPDQAAGSGAGDLLGKALGGLLGGNK